MIPSNVIQGPSSLWLCVLLLVLKVSTHVFHPVCSSLDVFKHHRLNRSKQKETAHIRRNFILLHILPLLIPHSPRSWTGTCGKSHPHRPVYEELERRNLKAASTASLTALVRVSLAAQRFSPESMPAGIMAVCRPTRCWTESYILICRQ